MSRWNEHEIARKLAERDELEPPAGLLEKIKGEIPPTIPVGVPRVETETRRLVPPPRQWLIAASLVAMVGAGLFALRVQREAPSMAALAKPVPHDAEEDKDFRAAAAPQGGQHTVAPEAPPPPRLSVPAPKPVSKEEERSPRALDYVNGASEGQKPAGARGGVAGGLVGASPPAAPPAAPPARAAAPAPAPEAPPPPVAEPEKDVIFATDESALQDKTRTEVRIIDGGNESGQRKTYDFDAFGEMTEPVFEDVSTHPVSIFRLGAGPAAEKTRRDLAAGKPAAAPPAPIDDLFSSLDPSPPARERGDLVITAEGAPTPYVQRPQYRLLRFAGVPRGALAEVRFNPAVVAMYRRIEAGAAALYEIELRPGAPKEGPVATLLLVDHPAARRELALSALAPSWEKASPDFRLAALAARFAEILKSTPEAKGDLAGIVRQVREIGKALPGSRAAELAGRMEKAAGLPPPP